MYLKKLRPLTTLTAGMTLNLQQLNHFDLPIRMLKIAFPKYKISKFPGEKFPRTPLDTPASRGRLSLGELFLSNALSLHSTGSRVLEFLGVRRISVVPNL